MVFWLVLPLTKQLLSFVAYLKPDERRLLAVLTVWIVMLLVLGLLFVRSLFTAATQNESLVALPISAQDLANASNRIYYASNSPLIVGLLMAWFVGLMQATNFLKATGLWLVAVGLCSLVFWPLYRLSRNMVMATKIWQKILFMAAGVLNISLLLIYCRWLLNLSQNPQWWLSTRFLIGQALLLLGWQTAIAGLADLWSASSGTLAATLPDNRLRIRRHLRAKKITNDSLGLWRMLCKVVWRNQRFKLVNLANAGLLAVLIVLSRRSKLDQLSTMIGQFGPTLLLVGLTAYLCDARSSIGQGRSAIFDWPVSAYRLISGLFLVNLVFSAISSLLILVAMQISLVSRVVWAQLVDFSFSLGIVNLLGLIIASLVVESRRNIIQGVFLSGLFFLGLWPLISHQQRFAAWNILYRGLAIIAMVVLSLLITVKLENYKLRKEMA